MYEGRPQRYGTQIVPDGTRYRLWDVDGLANDEDRAALDVPPLASQRARAAAMTDTSPQPPMDEAPEWLRSALGRWPDEEPRTE